MQLHELKPIHKKKSSKRIGRGGKRGTYSGRGIKGQKSRAGTKLMPIIRELIKRYPKLRGYRLKSTKLPFQIINLGTLEKKINNKEGKVNPNILIKMGLINKIKGKIPKVKILGKGKLTKKLVIEGCETSKSAKEIIEKVGGTVKMQNLKRKT